MEILGDIFESNMLLRILPQGPSFYLHKHIIEQYSNISNISIPDSYDIYDSLNLYTNNTSINAYCLHFCK